MTAETKFNQKAKNAKREHTNMEKRGSEMTQEKQFNECLKYEEYAKNF